MWWVSGGEVLRVGGNGEEAYCVVVEGGDAGELGRGKDGGLGPAGGVGDEAEEEVYALKSHGCSVWTLSMDVITRKQYVRRIV